MSERRWDIAEQARIAKASYDARPAWMKSISHFAGTNNVHPCGEATMCAACNQAGRCLNNRTQLAADPEPAKEPTTKEQEREDLKGAVRDTVSQARRNLFEPLKKNGAYGKRLRARFTAKQRRHRSRTTHEAS